MARLDSVSILARYQSAYRRANGIGIDAKYIKGWVHIGGPGGVATKHRLRDVIDFTVRLNWRAAQAERNKSENEG